MFNIITVMSTIQADFLRTIHIVPIQSMHLICNNSYKNKNYKLHPRDEELNVEIVIVVIEATLAVTKREPEIFRLVSESNHLPL